MRALAGLLTLFLLLGAVPARAQEDEEGDPAEVAVGERLFLETRFAHFFAAHAGGDPNAVLPAGDPAVTSLSTPSGPIPGPFAGQAVNCRSCHLVDDAKATPGGGNRAYADFARRSPVPAREDGAITAPRNSPSLVNSALARGRPFALHFDGEFPSAVALVEGTLTGRNFGWLPAEHDQAIRHIAAVVRGDDGTGALARDFGGSYRRVLAGTDPTLPRELRLAERFRVDVDRASDAALVRAVARLIAAYVESLEFANASPYDVFLAKNHLPDAPIEGELSRSYLKRLRLLLAALDEPAFVRDGEDGTFALQRRPFVFGPDELTGLRIFLDPRRGNCAACHVPPRFTDFGFHNTGVTQLDYDATHGDGSFAALAIPDLATRNADPDRYLPATPGRAGAREPFRSVASKATPGRTDLGLWNLVLDPDRDDRRFEHRLARHVCRSRALGAACRREVRTPDARLAAAVALFKTPGLRTLSQSDPYMHTGTLDTLEDVVRLYVEASRLAKSERLRNGARQLAAMNLGEADVLPLAAFLRSLDEDYE